MGNLQKTVFPLKGTNLAVGYYALFESIWRDWAVSRWVEVRYTASFLGAVSCSFLNADLVSIAICTMLSVAATSGWRCFLGFGEG